MKIITWNCNMAFRKKAASILLHKPDILIIQECEHPDKLIFPQGIKKPNDTIWFGENKNKGLGIFSYSKFKFKVLKIYNPEIKMVIPIAVSGGNFDFTLFAIWANNPHDPDGQYVEQVWKAIHFYDDQLKSKRTILTGDFNSNTIWDRKRRAGNHSNVVKYLEAKNIFSSYHLHHGQIQGKENHPTLFLYRHKNKPYHIDYCFVSKDFLKKIKSVEIGEYDLWKEHSDHAPVMVTFEIKNPLKLKARKYL